MVTAESSHTWSITLDNTDFVPEYYVLFLNCLCCRSIENVLIHFKLCFCALDNEI